MKLGVIGGLGPLASAYYYELLTKMSDVKKDQEHLELIIHSCPQIPDRTGYILDRTQENPVPRIGQIAKELENQNVDYIAIPCITAHYFHSEIIQYTHVPIIHLVEEVGQYLERNHFQCVGIMATTGTIQTQLFQKELEKRGIKCVIPKEERQEDVMHIIYDNVKSGKEIEMDRFQRVSQYLFDAGAQINILGCTELSIVKKEHRLDERYLDVMELLSAIALKKCHMTIKKEYQYLID